MGFWMVMLAVDLLVPVMMIGFALVCKKSAFENQSGI